MKRTVIWLTDEQIQTLTQMSSESLAPVSALIRKAVAEYLGRAKRKRRSSKKARKLHPV